VSEEVVPYEPDSLHTAIWHMRKMGMSWDAISDEISSQYEDVQVSPTQVASAYRHYMAQMTQLYGPEERTQTLALELERLNDLQNAAWPMAMRGEKDAIKSVLDVMKQRHRILGLDQADGSDPNVVNNVLVIGEDKAAWLEALAHGKGDGPVSLPGPTRDDEEDIEEGR